MTETDSNPQDGQVTPEKQTLAQEMKQAFQDAEQKDEDNEDTEGKHEVSTDEGETSGDSDSTETEREDNEPSEDGSTEEVNESEEITEKEFPLIPNNFSKDEKEAFQEALDSDDEKTRVAAEIFLERHNSMKKTFFKKTEELADVKKQIKPIADLFAPFEATMTANGIDKVSYMKNMMTYEMNLHNNPVATIKEIMGKVGITMEQLTGRKNDSFEFDDDLTDTSENVKLNQRLDNLERDNTNLRTQVANQPVQAQLRQFEVATDAAGKLLHPHYAEVKPIMGQLIQQSGNTLTLDKAYHKAIKVLDVNVEVETDDTSSAVDLDKIRQKVKRSKKASKGVSTKGGKTDFTSMSIKDELKARGASNASRL